MSRSARYPKLAPVRRPSETLPTVYRYGVLVALLLAWAGYVGPWVAHRAAGLVICGFDLAEYVKFLGEVRTGALVIWREWFILPAGALSLSLALVAVNRRLAYHWVVAGPLLIASLLAALSILPPAWTPALLLTPEFHRQTILMLACLGVIAASPLLRRLPTRALLAFAGAALLTTSAGALREFVRVKPAIDHVYGTPPPIGWGAIALPAGALLLSVLATTSILAKRR
jgi:hypothetical protein